jgi:ketosteroid isomerase-like protein
MSGRLGTRANIGTGHTDLAVSLAEIEILRAGYEAFNRREWASLFSSAAPDFELITSDRAMNAGTYQGTAAAQQVLEDLFAPFEQVWAELEEFLIAPDGRIVTLLIMRFRPHGSSAFVENRIAHVWTFRDGAVTRMHIFPERERALEAAGL